MAALPESRGQVPENNCNFNSRASLCLLLASLSMRHTWHTDIPAVKTPTPTHNKEEYQLKLTIFLSQKGPIGLLL